MTAEIQKQLPYNARSLPGLDEAQADIDFATPSFQESRSALVGEEIVGIKSPIVPEIKRFGLNPPQTVTVGEEILKYYIPVD